MAVEGWDFLSYKSREELVKTVAQELQCTEEMPQAYYEQFMQGHDRSTVAGAPWVDRLATKEEIADLTTVKSVDSAVAMVLDVHANFGRLLIPENIRKPELAVFFDLNTTLDGQAIGARTNDAREIVYPGLLVEIVIQTSTANVGPTGKIASGVVRCTGMTIYDEHCLYNQLMSDSRSMEQQTPAEDALREESVMVVGVRSSGLGGAITAEQEMVLLHSHVAPDDQLLSTIAAHSDSPSSNNFLPLDEWKPTQLNDCDLMAPGRVVLARVAILPSWIRKLSAGLVNVRYVASTIRSNGHTLHGIGRIVKYLEKGGLLEPIDGSANLIYFAIEFLPKTRGYDVQAAWPLDSCLMYEACRELPGRQFEWRAFRLMDMDELAAVSRSDPLPLSPSVTKETKSALELIKESDLLLSDMEVEMLKLLAPQCMKYLGL